MQSIYIEDTLHLIQGVDKVVSLKNVECLAVNHSVDYIKNYELNLKAGSSLTITSKITLDYAVGFSATFIMDYVRKLCDGCNDVDALLNSEGFEFIPSTILNPRENILLEVHNDALLQELNRLFKNPRDLSSRGSTIIIGSDSIARTFINEYQMALALDPYPQSDFFEESMRIAVNQKIKEEARKKVKLT